MPTPYETAIGSWTRRSTFFWAATGATVGLSNLWQFPYLARTHGGGLFILVYLACLLVVTLPLMLTETAIGRYSRHGIVLAMDGFIRAGRRSRLWMWAGRLSILSSFLVLSFTTVIGGICLAYVFYGALGRFVPGDELGAAHLLARLVSDNQDYREFIAWHAFFLLLVVWVSVQGVVTGLERAMRVVVPGILILLVSLLAFSVRYGDVPGAISELLSFRPGDLGWAGLRAALFHAFFTLGLGMGVWVIFGSYMPSVAPLKRSVFAVALMDTLVGVVAGIVLYALVFAHSPATGDQGFALIFLAIPLSLAEVPGSQFITAAVFLVVVLVAWTTALALLEPVVGWLREWTGAPRGWSVFMIGMLAWLVGLGSLLSFNIWSDLTLFGGTFFRWLELVSSGLLIPSVSILLAVFVSWYMTHNFAFSLIGKTPAWMAAIWYWVLRLVLPVVVAMIGVSYSSTSLESLCENGAAVTWCKHRDAVLPGLAAPDASVEDNESGAPESESESAAGGEGSEPDGAPGGGDKDGSKTPPTERGRESPAPAPKQENPQKGRDMHYHTA